MTRYLLDTSVLIDFSRGRDLVTARIQGLIESGDDLGVCAVNVAEFYSGVPPGRRPVWDRFLRALRYWDITRDVAMRAGSYRHDFARAGLTLSTADTLIAAVAYRYGAILLTGNVQDFPMSDIAIEAL